ncbi:DUF3102 domain-containing protein [Facklamia hominis]|uniref:DUF3102 domain-containing protein n=1 Tax=Facklamia hominis TaxID=178214 RepID=UPI0038FCD597
MRNVERGDYLNELTLSNDISRIETEIRFYKEQAGQSIWEIGRRLNHVKDHDLAHGQFGEWLDSIQLDHNIANRLMRVSREIPYSDTYQNLGYQSLYLISTLPEEEKAAELAKAEDGNPSTVRELRELKKTISQKDKEIESLTQRAEKAENKDPEVITKVVTKEVVPDDYEQAKADVREWRNNCSNLLDKYKELEDKNNELNEQLGELEEGSRKYQELTQAIQDMEGKMDATQKKIQAQKQVYELVDMSKELLAKITPIPYLIDAEYIRSNPYAKQELEKVAENVNKFLGNLKEVIKDSQYIEGVIIDE